MNLTKVLIPHPILIEEEIKIMQWTREHTDDFIQLSLRTIDGKSNIAEVNSHLDFWGESDIMY